MAGDESALIRPICGCKISVKIALQATASLRELDPGNEWEEIMDNAQRCRANALLCRQQACLHPEENWKWLAQAERWEHLAEASFTLKSEPPKAEPRNAA